MHPSLQPIRPPAFGPLALVLSLTIAVVVACTPSSGLPTQPQGTTGTATEATSSTPPATGSSGGNVVPVINF